MRAVLPPQLSIISPLPLGVVSVTGTWRCQGVRTVWRLVRAVLPPQLSIISPLPLGVVSVTETCALSGCTYCVEIGEGGIASPTLHHITPPSWCSQCDRDLAPSGCTYCVEIGEGGIASPTLHHITLPLGVVSVTETWRCQGVRTV